MSLKNGNSLIVNLVYLPSKSKEVKERGKWGSAASVIFLLWYKFKEVKDGGRSGTPLSVIFSLALKSKKVKERGR
jgi:hypothetical protein